MGPCSARVGGFGGQVILPLAHTIEHEEVSFKFLLHLLIVFFL